MGHLSIFTRMKGFWNIITTTVLKISKSVTFSPKMHLKISTKEIKSKTGEWFEPATHRLLAYP